jgi:predicted Zn-dependent protease
LFDSDAHVLASPNIQEPMHGSSMKKHNPHFRLTRTRGAIVMLVLSACAVNPATGGRMFSLVSEGQEIEMGQQAMLQVDAGMGLYDNPALQAYVDSVGQAMAAVSERPELPWSFKVVDDPVINAFALPGGPVYLARGIMAHFNSEAEMASVLGHEIGHITARHSVEQISRAQLMQIGLVAGVVLVPELRPFGDALGGGLGILFLKFGRDDESQSDELGFRYMSRLGYDPQGAVDMFEILERQRDASGGAIPEWQSTHPDPGNRVLAAEQRLATSQIEGGVRTPRRGFSSRGDSFTRPCACSSASRRAGTRRMLPPRSWTSPRRRTR